MGLFGSLCVGLFGSLCVGLFGALCVGLAEMVLSSEVLTMLCEEITVDDVDEAVQLLFDQTTQRNLQNELCEQFTVKTNRMNSVNSLL